MGNSQYGGRPYRVSPAPRSLSYPTGSKIVIVVVGR